VSRKLELEEGQARRSRFGRTARTVPLFQDNDVIVFTLQNLQHATDMIQKQADTFHAS